VRITNLVVRTKLGFHHKHKTNNTKNNDRNKIRTAGPVPRRCLSTLIPSTPTGSFGSKLSGNKDTFRSCAATNELRRSLQCQLTA
jgi:hypothetical protein